MTAPDPIGTDRYVNGVFKGGGAKGIAYAGALRAVRERKLWFKSVAGASAGAVTAALIASGMDVDEVERAVPLALASAKANLVKRLGSAVLGRRSSIYDSRGIRTWLDGALRTKIGKTQDGPVTFAELFAASGIELYVVAMDLARGTPMVLSRRTTPQVDVAGAVAASSAIPGAFPAGRGVFMSTDNHATVHALVDGGTWANYPSFIFQDQSFRTWLRASSEARMPWSTSDDERWNDECARPVIGFVLGHAAPVSSRHLSAMIPNDGPTVSPRFDRGPTFTSPRRSLHLIDLMLSNSLVRLLLVLAMGTWVVVTVLASSIMARRLSVWLADLVPDWLFPFLLVGVLTMVALAATVAISLVVSLVLVGKLIGDTLIPSMKALIGVPTGVTPWIGLGNDSVVLEVPCEGLETTEFSVSEVTRAAAVEAARASAAAQLDEPLIRARLTALLARTSPPEERPALAIPAAARAVEPDQLTVTGAVSIFVAATIMGGLAWKAVTLANDGEVRNIAESLLAGLTIGGAALLYLGGCAAVRSSARSLFGVHPSYRHRNGPMFVMAVSGVVLLVAGGLLSAATMRDRDPSTKMATVVSGVMLNTDSDGDGSLDARYNVEVAEAGTTTDQFVLVSDLRLRINERIFVDVRAGDRSARLAGALDDRRFAVSIVMWILAAVLLMSAWRSYIWITRCKRLAALAAAL